MGYTKSPDAPSVKPPDAEVSPNEVRKAASLDPYPQWIYGSLVAPEPQAAPTAGEKPANNFASKKGFDSMLYVTCGKIQAPKHHYAFVFMQGRDI